MISSLRLSSAEEECWAAAKAADEIVPEEAALALLLLHHLKVITVVRQLSVEAESPAEDECRA